MPKKLEKCVKKVEKKIKSGEIKKVFEGKKSSAYAICKASLKKRKR